MIQNYSLYIIYANKFSLLHENSAGPNALVRGFGCRKNWNAQLCTVFSHVTIHFLKWQCSTSGDLDNFTACPDYLNSSQNIKLAKNVRCRVLVSCDTKNEQWTSRLLYLYIALPGQIKFKPDTISTRKQD